MDTSCSLSWYKKNMKLAYKNPNTYLVLAVDAVLLYGSFWLSHWLRLDAFEGPFLQFFNEMVLPTVTIKLIIFSFLGLQSGMWRFTSVYDLMNIIKATLISSAVVITIALYFYYPEFTAKFSRSVLIIDALLTILFISAFRLSIRLFYSNGLTIESLAGILKTAAFVDKQPQPGIPALIYGAGERGEFLLRSIIRQKRNSYSHYMVMGLISDNTKLGGVSIHGYTVLGGIDILQESIDRMGIRELLVAERIDGDKFEQIYKVCLENNVSVRVVPSYLDGTDKKINADSLREIQIEDLLGREPASIDYSIIRQVFHGKRVLVTGGGGSIGSQLAIQLAELEPSQIVIVDKSENYLYQLEMDMTKLPYSVQLDFLCSNVTDLHSMDRIFTEYKPNFVFHAAAHKHVPMMENNRAEAIKNNIGGMKVVTELSEKHAVERFILISTDKAVNPSNVMGLTKRVCELYLQWMANKSSITKYMAVRFGNVLGSNGSVIPLFMRQIDSRGPVTVTHPDVERYFMTIPEAVLLILQSVTMGGQGDLFQLDMGKPIKIVDLANKMIQMAGFKPGVDIDIVFTGLRSGEKLQEELTSDDEEKNATLHSQINLIRYDNSPWRKAGEIVDKSLDIVNSDLAQSQKLLENLVSDNNVLQLPAKRVRSI